MKPNDSCGLFSTQSSPPCKWEPHSREFWALAWTQSIISNSFRKRYSQHVKQNRTKRTCVLLVRNVNKLEPPIWDMQKDHAPLWIMLLNNQWESSHKIFRNFLLLVITWSTPCWRNTGGLLGRDGSPISFKPCGICCSPRRNPSLVCTCQPWCDPIDATKSIESSIKRDHIILHNLFADIYIPLFELCNWTTEYYTVFLF